MIALAAAAAACVKEQEQELVPVDPENPNLIVFTAGAPSRTAIDASDRNVTWVAGDEVKFVWASGSATASASASGASTSFSVEVGADIDELYAVYPASVCGAYEEGKVNVHFNGSRTSGAFAANDICVARAVKTGDTWGTSLTFKNVACLFKVSVTDSDITKLKITSNGEEAISGLLPVGINNSGIVTFGEASSTGTSVNMEVDGPGDYYIPVMPDVAMSDGFRISRFAGEDQLTPFLYNGSFTTSRGDIYKFPDIDSHAGHYYVTPSGAGTKTGQNWNNAMDADQFKTYIETNDNYFILRGAVFHLSAAEFTFGDYLMPDFSGHSETAFTIEGTRSGSDITTFIGGSGDPAGMLWPKTSSNVTVKNVKFTGTNGKSNRAAIRVNSTGVKLQLEDCIFENNATSGQSAAVNLIKGIVTITDCEFTGNSASKGAALHVEGATVTVSGCTFADNSGEGNALHLTNTAAVVTMEDCDISGGNKCTVYGENANTVSFSRVNFHDNHADDDSGAAAWLEGAGTYTFTDCDFVDNAADWRAGAIGINSADVQVSFTGGKFQGNHSDGNGNYDGGAICVAKGSVDCTDVLFKENYSFVGGDTNAGGIIRLTSSGDCARFNNCVFDNNWSCRNKSSNASCAAIINCRNGGTKFYFNACEFKNNSSGRGYSSDNQQGGKSGQVMAVWAGATIAMNNCSMHDNYASRNVDDGSIYWICMGNASSKLILSNSSIIGDQIRRPDDADILKSKNGVIRFDADCYIHLINSIICSKYSDGKSVGCKATYNVPAYYCKVSPGLDGDTNWTNTTGFGDDYWADSSCFGGWTSPYTWNGTMTGTNSGMKAATADVNTEIQNADSDFYDWLNSIGALGKDINGNSRGATSWPGCYQN